MLSGHTMDGQSIAHYTITSKLGEGGMGEVYRATDAKLKRDVAIKILPDSMARNAQVLSRFEREAEVLAKLNHPNIATIFGIEDVDGSKAIVMELVEGDTLGERLQKGAMSVEECLPVFRQIASALEAAHEKGIIHRDLKPGNIKFTTDGQVKVLDFGLAKPTAASASEDDTEPDDGPTEMTMPGAVIGTPAYMSPEQTRGDTVDKRTDVWAFGCCLYECLTGRKPFKARTISDMMAEVLKSDPDFTLVPPETPNDILSLLRRCLEKEPRRRLRDIGDIAIRLEETTETSRLLERASPNTREESRLLRPARIAMALVMIVLAVGLAIFLSDRTTSESDGMIRSLAVLPFENQMADEELNWLPDAMEDSILEKLGKVDGLNLQKRELTLEQIRSEGAPSSSHSVDAFVSGRFFKYKEEIRCYVSLIDSRSNRTESLGEFSYDTEDQAIFEFNTEVATAIGKRVRGNLNDEERARLAESHDVDPAAYKAYRKGIKAFWNFTQEGFDEAEVFFRQALAIDPGYGEAVVLLANIPWVRTIWGGTPFTPQEGVAASWRILNEYSGKVRNPGALDRTKGWLAMYGERDWPLAERLFRNALSVSDSSVMVDSRAKYLALIEGRYQEAIEMLNVVLELEPDSLGLLDAKGECLALGGFYEKSIGMGEEILKRQPDHWDALIMIARGRLHLGQFSEALEAVDKAVDLSGNNPLCLGVRAHILAQSGEREQAKEILAALDGLADEVYVDQAKLADVDAALGDFDSAFVRLGMAAEMGGWGLIRLREAGRMETLGQDPRYWDLINRLKFPALPVYHPHYDFEQRMRFGEGRVEPYEAIQSLAILPFENLDPQQEWNLLAASMSGEIVLKLQTLDDVRILEDWIPLSKRQAEGKGAGEIASLLDVDALIYGDVVETEGKLQITARLHRRADGTTKVMGRFYHGSEDVIFEVQTNVALAIVRELQLELTDEEKAGMASSQTANPEAYEAYQKGMRAYGKFTVGGFVEAETYLRKAIERDPGYGAAVGALASIAWVKCVWGGTSMTFKEGLKKARSILDEYSPAVKDKGQLKPNEGWLALHVRDWTKAERLLRESSQLRLDSTGYAKYLNWVEGDHRRAVELINEDLELEPNGTILLQAKATFFFAEGRWEECFEMGERIIEQQPDHWDARRMMAVCLSRLGHPEEALKMADKSVTLSEDNPWCQSVRATLFALAGKPKQAREALTDLDERATKVFVDQGVVALVEGALGNIEKGVDRFERVVSEGGWGILMMREALTIELFGKSERFWKLIDRLNFPQLPVYHPYHSLELEMRYGKTPKTAK